MKKGEIIELKQPRDCPKCGESLYWKQIDNGVSGGHYCKSCKYFEYIPFVDWL